MSSLPFWRRLAWVSLVGLLGLLLAGFAVDAKGFAGNLLAEVIGIVVSAFIAVLLVDRFVEAERKARWQLVADVTKETLRFAVVKAALPIYLQLQAPRPPNADPFVMNEAGDLDGGLRTLSSELRRQAEEATHREPDLGEIARNVLPNTNLIRDVVLPRLILIGAEPDLIRPLVELEDSIERLKYDLWVEERFGLPSSALLKDLAELVDGFTSVASRFS
jgi:hypothetical protein